MAAVSPANHGNIGAPFFPVGHPLVMIIGLFSWWYITVALPRGRQKYWSSAICDSRAGLGGCRADVNAANWIRTVFQNYCLL